MKVQVTKLKSKNKWNNFRWERYFEQTKEKLLRIINGGPEELEIN